MRDARSTAAAAMPHDAAQILDLKTPNNGKQSVFLAKLLGIRVRKFYIGSANHSGALLRPPRPFHPVWL